MIFFIFFSSCNKTVQGKVVGIKASMGLNELQKGDVNNLFYEGKLIIEKPNGEKINALCDKELAKGIKGGQQVEIIFDKELDSWKIIRLIE